MDDHQQMLECLEGNKPFPWKKRGLIFQPYGEFSHGSHPCAVYYKDNFFIIAFTRRDEKQRSQIFLTYAEVSNGNISLIGRPILALQHGDPGHFDCDGVISASFVSHKNVIYLYYVGWQNLPDGLWICDTGRAILEPETLALKREFLGPVFGRSKNNPLFAAATTFYVCDDKWGAWYNSGIKWKKTNGKWHHRYGIHYAESRNGVDWVSHPGCCIPFADDYEYAFGRPTNYKIDNTFFMWFAHRASKDVKTYRIGFASSSDGLQWSRKDGLSGIDVSQSGWDSEMVCYPSVFNHKDRLYMLFNGNGYGKTGFGFATLETQR